MKKIFVFALTIVSIGQSFAETHKSLYTVSTFECIGIYCKVDSADLGECKVNYRPSGSKQWKTALPLWFDERDNEYRGSIVGLAPDTEYEVELAYGEHGIRRKPSFVRSQGLEFYLAPAITTVKWGKTPTQRGGKTVVITDKLITIPNPAIDAGVLIPGFNDDYKGKAPDMGAFERGNSPLKFGRHAQGQTVLTPWEEF